MFNKYFWPMFILVALVAGFHILGTIENYYWSTNWYDFPMHFFGGLWISLFILWFDAWIPLPIRPNSALKVIGFVLVVGIIWELYELYFQLTNIYDVGYTWDTSHDLIMDVLGGTLGWFLIHKKLLNKNEQI